MEKRRRQRILFILAGNRDKASSRVRGFWIADELQNRGFRCSLRWEQGKLAYMLNTYFICRHDIVIFQKTYSRYHRWLMALANKAGKQTYLDIDDAPSRVNSPITLGNFEAMCRMSDGVFAGSRNLLAYTSRFQKNSFLVPSSINLNYYQLSVSRAIDSNNPVCLGWIGNGKYYKNDLIEILAPPLREVSEQNRLRFKIIGASGMTELYDVFGAIPNLEIDFVDALDWSNPTIVSRAISEFDIGLYPLLPDEFNHYKCGFKALEYMAMGIPVIASAVANNADVVSHGKTGLVVSGTDEWIEALNELLKDPRRRVQMGLRGRRRVELDYDVATSAEKVSSIVRNRSI